MPSDRRSGDERREVERRALIYAFVGVAVERRRVERRVNVYRRSGWDRRGLVERRSRHT